MMLTLRTGIINMLWSNNLPVKPGYYWLRIDKYDTPRIVNIVQSGFHRYVYYAGSEACDKLELCEDNEWCGPLAPPG